MPQKGFVATLFKFVGAVLVLLVVWFAVSAFLPDIKTKVANVVDDLKNDAFVAGLAGGENAGDQQDSGPLLPETASVTTVVGPYLLGLESGEQVRLVGLTVLGAVPAEKLQQAVEFLRGNLEGETVRLEYDEENATRQHRGPQGNLLAYVYRVRDNFDMNAELVRQGHAYLDTTSFFGRSQEFLTYLEEAKQAERGFWDTGDSEDLPNETPAIEDIRDPTFYLIKDNPDFHVLGCRLMGKRRNRATGKNGIKESDARSQGMKLCYVCGINYAKIVYIDGRTFHQRNCPRLSDECLAARRPTAREIRKAPCNYCNP